MSGIVVNGFAGVSRVRIQLAPQAGISLFVPASNQPLLQRKAHIEEEA
jgi:hypothetical protein